MAASRLGILLVLLSLSLLNLKYASSIIERSPDSDKVTLPKVHNDTESFTIPEVYRNVPEEEKVSACIMFMDDNHRLSEWIAYHYHVMNLRNLIVTVDPNSETSPNLDRWIPYLDTAEVWNDGIMEFKIDRNQTRYWNHRKRQKYFNKLCCIRFNELGKHWTTTMDTDEFIRMHPDRISNTDILAKPGSIITFLKESRARVPTEKRTVRLRNPNATLDKNYLKLYEREDCITLGRVDFVDKLANSSAPYPSFVNESNFETLWWNQRKSDIDLFPKTLFNLRKFSDMIERPGTFVTVHQGPIFKGRKRGSFPQCQKDAKSDRHLFLNHYLGSWERFSHRKQDARGEDRLLRYQDRIKGHSIVFDHEASHWINGFVSAMGETEAKYLLQDAGNLD